MALHGEIKRRMRADIHRTFSLPASYTDHTLLAPVEGLNVRWHSSHATFGDLTEQGYAEVVDNVDRVVFDTNELAQLGITLREGGVVVILEDGWSQTTLILKLRDEIVGPGQVSWQVARG